MEETVVHEALLALLPSDETADWPDVLVRADERRTIRAALRRPPVVVGLAVVAALAVAGSVAQAVIRSSPEDVSAAKAATKAAALFDSPTGETPSSRALREGGSDVTWIRLPAVERRLDVQEFDLGITNEGSLCIEEIDNGSLGAGGGGCFGKLDPAGDLETGFIYSLGRPNLVDGFVSDNVTAVTLHTPDGDFPAQVADDIITWRAPARDPNLTPDGATVQLADGSSFDVGMGLSGDISGDLR